MPVLKFKAASDEPQQFMLGSVVGLSWQLALAVLLPLLGGHFLDRSLDSKPWFTLLGLILAMAGMIVVVSRSLKDVNRYVKSTKIKKDGE